MTITHQLQNRDEWLLFRNKGLGGSDAAVVLNKSNYKTRLELYKEKLGLKQQADLSDNKLVQYGKNAERPLHELFFLDFPHLQEDIENKNFTIYESEEYPFLLSSYDIKFYDTIRKCKGFSETKTATIISRRSADKWKKSEHNKAGMPIEHYCQVLHYFATDEELEYCILQAQLKHLNIEGKLLYKKTKYYHFERKDYLQDIEFYIFKAKDFWYENISKKEAPLTQLPDAL